MSFFLAALAIALLFIIIARAKGAPKPGHTLRPTELEILDQLEAKGGPMRGLDIVKASEGGVTRTNVYVQLATLEDEELVHSRYTDDPPLGGARRREYSITSRGRFELKRKT